MIAMIAFFFGGLTAIYLWGMCNRKHNDNA